MSYILEHSLILPATQTCKRTDALSNPKPKTKTTYVFPKSFLYFQTDADQA